MASGYSAGAVPQEAIGVPSVQLSYNPSAVHGSSAHNSSSVHAPSHAPVVHGPPVPHSSHQGGPPYATPAQVARPAPPQQLPPANRPQGMHAQPVSYQSKYGELLNVIEDLGREIKPTYAGSKMAQERLKKGIMHARTLVRECLAEVDKSARQ